MVEVVLDHAGLETRSADAGLLSLDVDLLAYSYGYPDVHRIVPEARALYRPSSTCFEVEILTGEELVHRDKFARWCKLTSRRQPPTLLTPITFNFINFLKSSSFGIETGFVSKQIKIEVLKRYVTIRIF